MTSSPPLQRLLNIMTTLRHPQAGCSWDRQQTFATLAPYTLEETYEVLDAIERQDYADLRDELGDVLFQVVFYAQMGKEQGLFNFDEVCNRHQRQTGAPSSAHFWCRQRERGGALGATESR